MEKQHKTHTQQGDTLLKYAKLLLNLEAGSSLPTQRPVSLLLTAPPRGRGAAQDSWSLKLAALSAWDEDGVPAEPHARPTGRGLV